MSDGLSLRCRRRIWRVVREVLYTEAVVAIVSRAKFPSLIAGWRVVVRGAKMEGAKMQKG